MNNIVTLTETFTSAKISVMGYNYDLLRNVFLSSSNSIFPSITSINNYTNLRRVSAICPPFSGFLLPLSSYTVLDKNRINIRINTEYITSSGYIDIIFANIAGYSRLSDRNTLIYVVSAPVLNNNLTFNGSSITFNLVPLTYNP
jgi:hypothetical protein